MIAEALVARAVVPRLLDTLRASWSVGHLAVEMPDGRTEAFGPEDAARRARIRIKSPVFFRKLDEVLAPRGLVALQAISLPDYRFEEYARHCDWIQRYIFPGSLLASLHHVTGAMSRVSRLGVHHLEDIGAHYALTLAEWRRSFLSKLDQVRGLGFDDRFIRMWDYYLAACEAYFATRRLGDLQLVLTRPGNPSLRGIAARRPVAA